MRRDMAKVIVERPRRGGMGYGGKSVPIKGYYKNVALEDLPKRQGMKRPYGWDRKELNEHLKPLKRYLEKQVGRPWNAVYRDISRYLRARNPVQQHVRDHIRDFVDRYAEVGEDGVVYPEPRYQFGRRRAKFRPGELYVDPRTGILRRAK